MITTIDAQRVGADIPSGIGPGAGLRIQSADFNSQRQDQRSWACALGERSRRHRVEPMAASSAAPPQAMEMLTPARGEEIARLRIAAHDASVHHVDPHPRDNDSWGSLSRDDETWDSRPSRSAASVAPGPCLFRLVTCDRPMEPSSRHLLQDVDYVTLGRAERAAVRREPDGDHKELHLGIADLRISSRHAHLRRGLEGWLLRDDHSLNGVYVKGRRVDRHLLKDGDIFVLGHTFFLFRQYAAPLSDAPPDVDAASLDHRVRGLATLSPELATQFHRLARIAPLPVEVLIVGESGTGKELSARALATLSGRSGPFVSVNCGVLSGSMVEPIFFGRHHQETAVMAEHQSPPGGVIPSANGGTLFLDEIDQLPLHAQAALLRILEERQVTPAGAAHPISVDFRLCSSSHRRLDELAAQGHFRADLLARICSFMLELPPLRARREDFGLLLGTILASVAGSRAHATSFTKEAMRVLIEHDWPLNVRELEDCLRTATTTAMDGRIDVNDVRMPLRASQSQVLAEENSSPPDQMAKVLTALLTKHNGNITAVAREYGKDRIQIRRWLRRFQIDPRRFRTDGSKVP